MMEKPRGTTDGARLERRPDTRLKGLSATSIVNDDVVNAMGENLGHIEDLMIDLDRGCVAYAVLSFGGVLGIGDKLFAVPWSALKLDTEHKQFVLNVPKERLENAPGFDKDNWPGVYDRTEMSRIYEYYDQPVYW
jgi:sporulation protein YlmC with PRC-barrel domain